MAIVPEAVDADMFNPATMRPERVLALRKLWNVPNGNRVILVPGPLAPAEGQDVLIEAAAMTPPHLLRDVTFVLIGETRAHRRYARALSASARRRRIAPLFVRPGACTDWPAALAAADFVVIPAVTQRLYGDPIPQSQTMARPVIASAAGILPEHLLAPPRMPKSLRTGWIVPPGDPQALAETLTEAISSIWPATGRWPPAPAGSRNSCFRRKTLPLRSSKFIMNYWKAILTHCIRR
ncbi:MAG: glycosyltransferase [Pseudorhodoplanes sp.]|nr:glycosyltransferase [Pseudorhodoplanes sp.]